VRRIYRRGQRNMNSGKLSAREGDEGWVNNGCLSIRRHQPIHGCGVFALSFGGLFKGWEEGNASFTDRMKGVK